MDHPNKRIGDILYILKEADPEKVQSVRFLMRRCFAERYREKIHTLYKEMTEEKPFDLSHPTF